MKWLLIVLLLSGYSLDDAVVAIFDTEQECEETRIELINKSRELDKGWNMFAHCLQPPYLPELEAKPDGSDLEQDRQLPDNPI